MGVITKIFRTEDGKEFNNLEDAEKHGDYGDFLKMWKREELTYHVDEENFDTVFEELRAFFSDYFTN